MPGSDSGGDQWSPGSEAGSAPWWRNSPDLVGVTVAEELVLATDRHSHGGRAGACVES